MSSGSLTRRRFLATAAGGPLLAATRMLHAAPGVTGENEHFIFRIPSGDEPYIDSQRANKAFAFQDGRIMLSEDCGKSWAHTAEFADASNITFSVILKNGNVLFATRERLYLSTDQLKSHREIVVKRADGTDYLPHQPVKPDLPGWYFHSLDGEHCFEVGGREMLVWGNYCNVLGGCGSGEQAKREDERKRTAHGKGPKRGWGRSVVRNFSPGRCLGRRP